MSYFNFSAVGKQFSTERMKIKKDYEHSRFKQKSSSEWCYRNSKIPVKKLEMVNWHKQCLVHPNSIIKSKSLDIDQLVPLFEDR